MSQNKTQLKIKSIKSLGVQDVWDISVLKDHSYVSKGGFINHNCSDPNVMNIPAEARDIIIARENHSLITSDYSSYEFRCAAARTGEQYMIDLFEERYRALPDMNELCLKYGISDPDHLVKAQVKGHVELTKGELEIVKYFGSLDIHRRNASLMLGIPVDQIDDKARSIGKTGGYALLYGSGPRTMLGQLLKSGVTHITMRDCEGYRAKFFSEASRIDKFIKEVHEAIIDPGYITTIMGRKKFFSLCPKYMTNRYNKELADAQRQAVNACFQASNADATKLAMVMMEDGFGRYVESPLCLLNVHDETVTEAHDSIVKEVAYDIVVPSMIKAGEISVGYKVPIEVSCAISKNWAK